MMVINNRYNIEDTLYLKTDKEQLPRIVVAFTVYKSGELVYKLTCGTDVSDHYDFELTDTKNEVLAL